MKALWVYGVALTVGCGASNVRVPSHGAAAPIAARSAAATPSPMDEYVPSAEAIEYGRLHFGGRGRALVDGVRVAADEPPCTDSLGALLGGLQIPEHLGKGFLFWNNEEFYRSDTFTGPLVSAGRLPIQAKIKKASFGPKAIVFHLEPQGRFAWSPETERVAPMPAEGLIDIAPLGDGRFVEWLEPGLLLLPLGNGGAHRLDAGQIIRGLETNAGRLDVTAGHDIFVIDDQLSLVPLSAHEYVPMDRSWIGKEYPLGMAFSGVSLGAERAVAYTDDVFVTIDRRSRKVLDVSEPLPIRDCVSFPTPNDILALCSYARIVVSGIARNQPRIERMFGKRAQFSLGSTGHLIKQGRCSPQPSDNSEEARHQDPEGCCGDADSDHSALCIRSPNGRWQELTIDGSTLPQGIGNIRWVPTSDGAVGMIFGVHPGLYDTRTKRFRAASAEFNNYDPTVHSLGETRETLYDSMTVLPDGSIAGYIRNEAVHLLSNGEVRVSGPRFRKLSSSGPNALGFDKVGRLLQSTDFGQHWQEVRLPPHGTKLSELACSYMGCRVSDWLRIGYPTTPVHVPPMLHVGSHPAIEATPTIPWLECKSRPDSRPGEKMRAPSYLAFAHALSRDYRIRVSDFTSWPVAYRPFLKTADSEPLASHDYLAPQSPPEAEPYLDTYVPRRVIPILAEYPKTVESLHIEDRREALMASIMHGHRLVYNKHPLLEDMGPQGAMAEGHAGQLYSLSTNRSQPDHDYAKFTVLRTVGPQSSEVMEVHSPDGLPVSHPDTIALNSEGEPGILRLWSTLPPTSDDPAFFFNADEGFNTLAPWSTLQTAPCGTEPGYRAIINIEQWLRLSLNGMQTQFGDATALVYWNDKRVCLEAIAGTFAYSRQAGTLILSAEFGAKATASLYQPSNGTQYVQPVTCFLKSP